VGERLFHLNREVIQSLMYLKLSVAGHMTIFVTRTRKAFWSVRPATVLLVAVIATQLVATLIAVYGFFMAPIGWPMALLVWGYAFAWFLVNDRVKLAAYSVFDKREGGLLARFYTRVGRSRVSHS
jgi:H+-transporting ATPase